MSRMGSKRPEAPSTDAYRLRTARAGCYGTTVRRLAIAVASLTVGLLAPTEVIAQGVNLTARSVYHAYEIQLAPGQNRDAVRDVNRFYQTLEASGWGLVPPEKVNAVLSMRYRTDFGTGFARDTPMARGIPAVDGRDDLQLLYAYVEWVDAFDRFDFRIGRQVRMDDLAWASFDGIEAKIHVFRDGEDHLDVSVFAGVPVQIDLLFSSETFLGDGIEVYDGSGFLNGLTFGGDAALQVFGDLTFSAAYRQTVVFRDDDLQTFAGDAAAAAASAGSTGLQESLFGASIGYEIRPADVNLYGHFNWDLLLGNLEQARAGAAFHPMRGLTARAEYLRVRPRFVGDSIFNYFNIFAYDRGRGEVSWELVRGLTVDAGYFLQKFNGGAKGPKTVDGDPGSEGADFTGSDVAHGPSGGLTYRHPRFTLGGSIEASTNFGGAYAYGGNYRLMQAFGDVRFLGGRFVTDARLAVTTFQNDWIEGADAGVVDDPHTSLIGSIGARAQLLDFLSWRVLLAKNISSQVAGSYRVFSELAMRY